ncbi:TIGR02117 family protein [Gramella sp. MT6]|uniref:TIGR02117 family protein n=1 Tax=Gramella sp. MT6 TaxID=2705471 RepID=UPI001C5E77F6|nr:TIGR02117 family protein [Gramella sp. MT6]QYA25834.1 TIGR02117 family protein [Gramella sp. MT6]
MNTILKYLRNLAIIVLLPAAIYLIFVIIGALIPVNTNAPENPSIQIYLVKNGAHTDIVVPISNHIIHWENYIKPAHFPQSSKDFKYYSFGWGDREFYRTTPYWKDLRFKIAVKALFLNTPSAMHIYRLQDIESEKVIPLKVTNEQYKKLSGYFLKHLRFSEGSLNPLEFRYSENDVFYNSESLFHAFRTCNTWANSALKVSGIRACLWTPFAEPLLWQFS